MRHWSRNDRFAFFGVILAAIGVAGAVFPQEIRHSLGLDNGTPAAQSSTIAAPAPSAVKELKISVTGDENTVTFLPASSPDDATVEPVTVLGDHQEATCYLGKGVHAVVSLIGDDNTLLLDPKVKSRVQQSTMGDGTKVQTIGAK